MWYQEYDSIFGLRSERKFFIFSSKHILFYPQLLSLKSTPLHYHTMSLSSIEIATAIQEEDKSARKMEEDEPHQYLLHRDSWAPSRTGVSRCWERCSALRWSNREQRPWRDKPAGRTRRGWAAVGPRHRQPRRRRWCNPTELTTLFWGWDTTTSRPPLSRCSRQAQARAGPKNNSELQVGSRRPALKVN